MAETSIPKNEPRADTLRRAAAVNSAAARAVAQIQDPQRRAKAQQLLDGMRSAEAQQRGQARGKLTAGPKAQRPGGDRDRGTDSDR